MSVITPTLNRVGLLERTIRSVRNQTFSQFEHLIIDGGSTDGTQDLLQRYSGTYPMRWVSEPDGGMYEAINKGLRLAAGEILSYLNSDDLYLPWTLDVVVEQFRCRVAADFMYGGVISVDEATGGEHLRFQPPFDVDFVRRVGFLNQPAVFWRRRVFEAEGGFDESLLYVADCDYWMRLGGRRSFVRINEFLAVERQHSSTFRESHGDAVWAELAMVRARYATMHGLRHRVMVAWHATRRHYWLLADWTRFMLWSVVPWPQRGGWSHLLRSGIALRWLSIPARLVPLGSRTTRGTVRSSHNWLEPPP